MPVETTPSYLWYQLLLLWSCFVDPDHVPLTSGESNWDKIEVNTTWLWIALAQFDMRSAREDRASTPSPCFFIGSLLLDDLCHWVSVPHMSLLTGSHQDAVAMENVQLKQMSTPPPISQFPGRTCILFWWKTRDGSWCVWGGCTCTHMYGKWHIKERGGRAFF